MIQHTQQFLRYWHFCIKLLQTSNDVYQYCLFSKSGQKFGARCEVTRWINSTMNVKAIFAVMNTTWAEVKIRTEKKFRPVHYCEDHFHIHVFIRSSNIWLSYIHSRLIQSGVFNLLIQQIRRNNKGSISPKIPVWSS